MCFTVIQALVFFLQVAVAVRSAIYSIGRIFILSIFFYLCFFYLFSFYLFLLFSFYLTIEHSFPRHSSVGFSPQVAVAVRSVTFSRRHSSAVRRTCDKYVNETRRSVRWVPELQLNFVQMFKISIVRPQQRSPPQKKRPRSEVALYYTTRPKRLSPHFQSHAQLP